MTDRKPTTLIVHGHKISNRSNRRYLAVAVRPEPVVTDEGAYVAFASVLKRSDKYETAARAAYNYGHSHGAFAVVVDSLDGEVLSK